MWHLFPLALNFILLHFYFNIFQIFLSEFQSELCRNSAEASSQLLLILNHFFSDTLVKIATWIKISWIQRPITVATYQNYQQNSSITIYNQNRKSNTWTLFCPIKVNWGSLWYSRKWLCKNSFDKTLSWRNKCDSGLCINAKSWNLIVCWVHKKSRFFQCGWSDGCYCKPGLNQSC